MRNAKRRVNEERTANLYGVATVPCVSIVSSRLDGKKLSVDKLAHPYRQIAPPSWVALLDS